MILWMNIPLEENDYDFMEGLYRRYGAMMRYAARRMGASDQDAEDALHDTFLRLCHHIPALRQMQDNKLASYIVISICNRVRDQQRIRGAARFAGEEALDALPDRADPVDDQAIRHLTVEEMMRQLERLPPKLRDILRLHDLVGWKDREIAQLMGLSPASVRVYLGQARKQLGLQLREELGEDEEDA